MKSAGNGTPLVVSVDIQWAAISHVPITSEERAENLIRHALQREARNGSWHFVIRFIDDNEMSRLHETFLNDASPTDIMTFPIDPEEGEAGADMVISVDTAVQNASEANWSLTEELDFLMLHGLLHVLGWDDRSDSERTAMLNHQYRLLGSWSRQAREN